MTRPLLALILLALPACAVMQPPAAPTANPEGGWRGVATDDDRERLRDWRSTFVAAVQTARAGGHAAQVDAEGTLLDPDAALPGGRIPDGDYRCRTIKVGARSAGLLDFVSYAPFRCRVAGSGALQSFTKLTGSQRQVGTLYPADPLRQAFLGTLVLGDETRAMTYGVDPDRNVAGWVERIGPARWRMQMPRPRFESQLDVLELVPVAQGDR